jgi:peptidyl-tRNA hydrolase
VRKDLPLGVLAAQLTHAAGESAALLQKSLPPRTRAIVLSVPNQEELIKLEQKLINKDIKHYAVREPDLPWDGALMAIGVVPTPLTRIRRVFYNLPLLTN